MLNGCHSARIKLLSDFGPVCEEHPGRQGVAVWASLSVSSSAIPFAPSCLHSLRPLRARNEQDDLLSLLDQIVRVERGDPMAALGLC